LSWARTFLFSLLSSSPALATMPYQGELSPEGVSSFIQANKIGSVDELMSWMPERLLGSFTLAHQSQSIQASCTSESTPRVILFSPDDDFVMAVTGNLSGPGCGNIEMMKLERASSSFNFKEFVFGENGGLRGQSCLQCHSNDPRPIWNDYSHWPGFYGEADDVVDEATFLKSKKGWMNADVYRHLVWKNESSSFPYRLSEPSLDAGMRPNLRLGMMLAREEARRLARMIEEQPGFSAYRFPILFRYLECGSFSNPTFDANIAALFDVSLLQFAPSGTIFKPDRFTLLEPTLFVDHANDKDTPFFDGTRALYLFLQTELMRDLVLVDSDLKPYFTPQSIVSYYGASSASRLFPPNEDFSWVDRMGEALDPGTLENRTSVCKLLQEKGTIALKAIQGKPIVSLNAVITPADPLPSGSGRSSIVFSKCIDCHRENSVAPQIPFDNDVKFKAALLKMNYPHGNLYSEIYYRVFETTGADRMPPGEPLDGSAIRLIADYLGTSRSK